MQTQEQGRNRGAGYADISSIAPRIQGERGADRGFIVGRSGSGKSYLAEELVQVYGPDKAEPFKAFVVKIDTNHTMREPTRRSGIRLVSRPKDVVPSKQAPIIHFRPEDLTADGWNEVWKALFESKLPILTYVDEAYAMERIFNVRRTADGRNFLNAYLTQGRARMKAALFSAQRPVLVPRHMVAQAEWFYQFDLPWDDDRRLMAGVMGRNLAPEGEDLTVRNTLGAPERKYNFAFKSPDLTDPIRLVLV